MPFQKTGRYSRRWVPGGGWGATKIVGKDTEEDSTEYKAPEYDLKRIRALTQEQLSPAISGVRRAIQMAQAKKFATPTAAKEYIRGAVRGGGEAIGAAQAGATRSATALYAKEFEGKQREEELRYKKSLIDEQRDIQRGASSGGETYREATQRLLAYDPWGTKSGGAVTTPTTTTTDYMSQI